MALNLFRYQKINIGIPLLLFVLEQLNVRVIVTAMHYQFYSDAGLNGELGMHTNSSLCEYHPKLRHFLVRQLCFHVATHENTNVADAW